MYVEVNRVIAKEEDAIKVLETEIKEKRGKGEDTKALEAEVAKLKDASTDEAARRYFKRMVDSDQQALDVWKRFRSLSIERYKQTYARLNIRYDDYSGESQVKEESMAAAAKIMEEKGVSENSDGAVIVDLTRFSKRLGKAILQKKDGTSLYLTRDIGAMRERYDKYHFDKVRQ